MKKWLIGLLVVVGASSIACGFEDDDNGTTFTESSSSSSFKCCVNGRYYDCANSEEFQTCGETFTECSRDSSQDDLCE